MLKPDSCNNLIPEIESPENRVQEVSTPPSSFLTTSPACAANTKRGTSINKQKQKNLKLFMIFFNIFLLDKCAEYAGTN